jgi:hypothetical protein
LVHLRSGSTNDIGHRIINTALDEKALNSFRMADPFAPTKKQ